MPQFPRPIALGIDIGTTKVALALVDSETKEVLATTAKAHESDVGGLPPGRSEQLTSRILSTLEECIAALPIDARALVGAVGVTGQMHGVVLWDPGSERTSNLVTWQDQRCVEDSFLEQLRAKTGDSRIQTGFGLATLAWLAHREPKHLASFSKASTIHDLVVAKLSNAHQSFTDPSDAASWGLFDIRTRSWLRERVERTGVALSFLPEIRPAGAFVGELSATHAKRWGMPAGVPIANALGDNQASLYGSLTDPQQQVALTIGTGAQLSVVVPDLPKDDIGDEGRYEYRPYVGESYIAVAASLSGGRALAALAHAIRDIVQRSGVSPLPSLDALQSAMHAAGLERIETDLVAHASLGGERYDATTRGSFSNLTFDNFSIGDMTAALARGLVQSLHDALPPALLAGRHGVVGSGNAITRSPLVQQIIREVFGCSLTLTESSETTASGAALLTAASLRSRAEAYDNHR